MSITIIKTNNFNFGDNVINQQPGNNQLYEGDLATHIGTCLQMIPPKQLCRCLRESCMLRLEELQQTTPDFKNFLTELTILFARLDALEDGTKKVR